MLEEVVAPALLPVPSKWVRCGREVDAVLPVLDDWDDNEGDKEGRAAAPLADIYWVRWLMQMMQMGRDIRARADDAACCYAMEGGREGGRGERCPLYSWSGPASGMGGRQGWTPLPPGRSGYGMQTQSGAMHMGTLYTQMHLFLRYSPVQPCWCITGQEGTTRRAERQ